MRMKRTSRADLVVSENNSIVLDKAPVPKTVSYGFGIYILIVSKVAIPKCRVP